MLYQSNSAPDVYLSHNKNLLIRNLTKWQGIIEPSDSPWSSPLVIVTKKSGDIRVCVDYSAINSVMRKSAIPLPRIQECLDSLLDQNTSVLWTWHRDTIRLLCTQMTNVKLHLLLEEALQSCLLG